MVTKMKKKNIQAIVRVRPLNGAEIMDKARSIVSVDQYDKTIKVREKATGMKPYGPFDRVCAFIFLDNHLVFRFTIKRQLKRKFTRMLLHP
jgi:hypothetical protein